MIQFTNNVMADKCSTNSQRVHGGNFGDGGFLMVLRGGLLADG